MVVLLMAGSFAAGMQLQKSLKTTGLAQANPGGTSAGALGGQNGGFGGRFGGGPRPTIGIVSGVNGNSISLTTRTGGAITITISGSTQIIDASGNTAVVSDIQTGQTLFVSGTPDNSGNVVATRVRINPTAAGNGPSGNQPSSSGSAATGI